MTVFQNLCKDRGVTRRSESQKSKKHHKGVLRLRIPASCCLDLASTAAWVV